MSKPVSVRPTTTVRASPRPRRRARRTPTVTARWPGVATAAPITTARARSRSCVEGAPVTSPAAVRKPMHQSTARTRRGSSSPTESVSRGRYTRAPAAEAPTANGTMTAQPSGSDVTADPTAAPTRSTTTSGPHGPMVRDLVAGCSGDRTRRARPGRRGAGLSRGRSSIVTAMLPRVADTRSWTPGRDLQPTSIDLVCRRLNSGRRADPRSITLLRLSDAVWSRFNGGSPGNQK